MIAWWGVYLSPVGTDPNGDDAQLVALFPDYAAAEAFHVADGVKSVEFVEVELHADNCPLGGAPNWAPLGELTAVTHSGAVICGPGGFMFFLNQCALREDDRDRLREKYPQATHYIHLPPFPVDKGRK